MRSSTAKRTPDVVAQLCVVAGPMRLLRVRPAATGADELSLAIGGKLGKTKAMALLRRKKTLGGGMRGKGGGGGGVSRDTSPNTLRRETSLQFVQELQELNAPAAAGDRHHEPPREELAFSCDIPALGLSLIDSVPCELLRLTIESVGVDYVKKPAIEQEQSLDFSVGRVQLDNQRMHAAFPVVLTPSKVDPWHRKSDEDEGKTMAVRFTLNESMPNMTVFYQPEIYLAPLSLQIEEALFRAIQGMLKSVGVLEEDTGEEKALKDGWEWHELEPTPSAARAAKIVFDELTLPALSLDVSMRTDGMADTSDVVEVLTELFFNIDRMPVRASKLQMENQVATVESLSMKLVNHYWTSALWMVVSFLFSLDVIGSPIELLRELLQGLTALTVDPILAELHHEGDGFPALAHAGAEFAKLLLHLPALAVTKVFTTLARNLSILALDSEWERSHARREVHRPVEGLAAGALALLEGIREGVVGVLQQPRRGWKESHNRRLGLATGAARGALGLFIKPLVGAMDLVGKSAEGLKNVTSVHNRSLQRVRPPLAIKHPHRLIQPFNDAESRASLLLSQCTKKAVGVDESEFYIEHHRVDVRKRGSSRVKPRVVLVTTKRVVYGTVEGNEGEEGPARKISVIFEVPKERMARVELYPPYRDIILWTWTPTAEVFRVGGTGAGLPNVVMERRIYGCDPAQLQRAFVHLKRLAKQEDQRRKTDHQDPTTFPSVELGH